MNAIPTKYAGYYFRSRLEARWAIFFDAMAERWEYEREGYVLSDGNCYLPDFWLPDMNLYLEVKGQSPTEDEYSKAQQLRDTSNCAVAIFHGLPSVNWGWLYCWDSSDGSDGAGEWEIRLGDTPDGRLALLVSGFDPDRRSLFANQWDKSIRIGDYWLTSPSVDAALIKAKSEQFNTQKDPAAILAARLEALEQRVSRITEGAAYE